MWYILGMITIKRIFADDKLYGWALKLLEISFPHEERRDGDLQKEIMSHSDYRLCAICDGGEPVGAVGYFDAPEFVYFENFCVSPDKRSRGYGGAALKLLTDGLTKPFILESELPTDELTKRRIAFYKRNGMTENPFTHVQPHYRKTDPDLYLLVMSYGKPLTQSQYNAFKKYLDENVDVK